MVDYVIWDMDGTILNTIEDIADSVNYVLKNNGFPLRTTDEIRSFVGNGIPKLIERSVPDDTKKEKVKKYLDEMLDYYKDHSMIKTAPYEGITELMSEFRQKGIKTAVVTNKVEKAAIQLRNDLFDGLIDVVIGNRLNLELKPAPDGVFEAIKALGADKNSKIVYIGDSEVDVRTAHNAKLECIGVLWGFRDRETLEESNCDYIVEDITELKKVIFEKL